MKTFIAIIAFMYINAVAQPKDFGFPFISNYSPREYRAAEDNWSCVQDKRGVMYFANQNGILEYDGEAWNIISVAGDRYANALAIDSAGRVWVGGINDFGYLRAEINGEMKFVSLRTLLPDTTIAFRDIWSVVVWNDGIYFSSENYIFRFYDNIITTIPTKTNFNLLHTINGRLFVDQLHIGLCEVKNDSVTLVPGGKIFFETEVNAILPYDSKRWLIAEERGWYLYDGKRAVRMKTEADFLFKQFRLYRALLLSNGTYVFATAGGGVVVMDKKGKILQRITKSNGLQSDMALHLFLDRQYGLWVSQFVGISRIDILSPISRFDDRNGIEGLPFNVIRHKNKLYVATVRGLYEQDNSVKGKTHFIRNPIVADDCRGVIGIGNDILAGCIKGIFLVRNGSANKLTSGYTESFVRSVLDSSLMYSLEFGVRKLYYRKGNWIDGGLIPGPREVLSTLIETENGTLWVQTLNDGILKVNNHFKGNASTIMRRYTMNDGLPSLAANPAFYSSGVLRVGFENGMFRFDSLADNFVPDSAFHFQFSPPLPFENLRFYKESDSTMWVVSNKKRGASYVRWYQKGENGKFSEQYSSALQLNDMNIRMLYHESPHRMWFSNEDGLYRYDRSIEKNINQTFNTHIRTVAVSLSDRDSLLYFGNYPGENGVATATQSENYIPVLPYDKNKFRFEFTALSYDNVHNNQYQYLLEGQDSEWSQWNSEYAKEYTNLSAGKYRFRVRAKNAYRMIGIEDSFRFAILPPFWGTWWFRSFIVFFFMLFGPIIYYWRVSNLKKERSKQQQFSQKIIESQEYERKRIASELHDSLGQNLLIIKNLIDMSIHTKTSKKALNEQLGELSDIASRSIEETRIIASNLHPYQLSRMGLTKAIIAMMRNLEQSTKISLAHSIDKVEGIFSKETEAHLYRIVQESVNNVLKHSKATAVIVEMKKLPAQIRITISDNGKGFDAKIIEQKETVLGGLGLFGLHERARIIGGNIKIQSAVGKGTTVELTVSV